MTDAAGKTFIVIAVLIFLSAVAAIMLTPIKPQECICEKVADAPPFPTPIWTRDREDAPWSGPWCSSGNIRMGQIVDINGIPWSFWTTTEPDARRRARLEGKP